jgi:hypothetical protein
MHGITVNLPSSPSSESEASDEILLEQKIVSRKRRAIEAAHRRLIPRWIRRPFTALRASLCVCAQDEPPAFGVLFRPVHARIPSRGLGMSRVDLQPSVVLPRNCSPASNSDGYSDAPPFVACVRPPLPPSHDHPDASHSMPSGQVARSDGCDQFVADQGG